MRYASRTKVPVHQSRHEIERIITRYKADQFGSAIDNEKRRAMVQFRIQTWLVRFILPLTGDDAQDRQRWRAMALTIKAKLEAVECKIATFESEFLGNIVLPNQQTMGEWAIPQLKQMRETGALPKMDLLEDKRR